MNARPLDASGVEEVAVHLVPALIEHNGPAAVHAYFRPQETGASVDGLPVLQCSLRGRTLAGVRLPLPAGYSGAVLECQQQDAVQHQAGSSQDDSPDSGARTKWATTATFSSLHYYNHDAAPLRGDGLRRCLEWADLSAQVHRAVEPDAVVALLAASGEAAAGQHVS